MKQTFILSCCVAILMIGIAVFAYLHGGMISVLNPHGGIAFQERSIIVLTLYLCAIVVVPVFILLFTFAWIFRADNPKAKKEHAPNWDHDSWSMEFFWWIVPSIIVFFLAILAWQSSHQLDPYVPIKSTQAPITVQVIALDWKWLFIYPDQHVATVNELEFPENTPIHFEITADAPMNSFWIPSLGGQIMAMPGMSNQLNLIADTAGTYRGSSANISGKGFSGMTFTATSVSREEFDRWVASTQHNSKELSSTTYASLVKPSENVAPTSYSLADEKLYTSIIMSYMMPPTH